MEAVSTAINDTPPWSVGVVSSFWNPLRVGIRSLGVVAVRAQRGPIVVVVVGIVVVVVAVVVVEVAVCVGWGGGFVTVQSFRHSCHGGCGDVFSFGLFFVSFLFPLLLLVLVDGLEAGRGDSRLHRLLPLEPRHDSGLPGRRLLLLFYKGKEIVECDFK